MKVFFVFILGAILFCGTVFTLYAQDDYYQEYEDSETSEESTQGVFYLLSYGGSASWLVRRRTETITLPDPDEGGSPVRKNEELTCRDFFPGLYLNVDIYNLKFNSLIKNLNLDIIPAIRLAAYYPLNFTADTSTINKKPQRADSASHFGADILIGLKLELLEFDYCRINLKPALHMLYLGSDKWNYFNMGGAIMAGFELPLNERLTFLIDGCVSIDSGNLGSNRDREPFNYCSQYQVDLGFSYSAQKTNDMSLFGPKKTKKNTNAEYDEYN